MKRVIVLSAAVLVGLLVLENPEWTTPREVPAQKVLVNQSGAKPLELEKHILKDKQ